MIYFLSLLGGAYSSTQIYTISREGLNTSPVVPCFPDLDLRCSSPNIPRSPSFFLPPEDLNSAPVSPLHRDHRAERYKIYLNK